MPTAFTHAFVGAGVAIGWPRHLPIGRLIAAATLLATLPDLDAIAFSLGIPYDNPLGHRGFSHSLVFAAMASLAVAIAFFPSLRRGSRHWWAAMGALFVAGASHGLLDAFTDAGLGVGFFIPFDSTRYFFPWRPLATSPVSISAFFEGDAGSILATEAICVWLPLVFAVGLATLGRRLASR